VRIATGQKNLLVKSDKKGIELIKTKKNIIPSDRNAVINVKYNKFSKDNYVSAFDIINNDFDHKRVENKIILIGSSAQALFDIVKISNGKTVPGVEVHAHIIDNILKNQSISKNIYSLEIENISNDILNNKFEDFNPGQTKINELLINDHEKTKIKEEFWNNVKVPGTASELNIELEKAGRLADFIELGELMAVDALQREESCGGHFREEHQTDENEAKRNDEVFNYVSAWETKNNKHVLHQEKLVFENVKLSTRSYK